MTDWLKIIAQAQLGEKGSTIALELICKDTICQKKAYTNFIKYKNGFPATASVATWKDVLTDTAVRFVQAVHRGKAIQNGEAFFETICKNYCLELTRDKPKDPINNSENVDTMQPIATEKTNEIGDTEWCKKKLLHYVSKLPPQCQKLMHIMYFNNPPEENLAVIADLMGIAKEAVQPMAWSCRKKLKELIGNNLDDCRETLFNNA